MLGAVVRAIAMPMLRPTTTWRPSTTKGSQTRATSRRASAASRRRLEVGLDDGELVAAQARKTIHLPQFLAQAHRHFDQQAIADMMPE